MPGAFLPMSLWDTNGFVNPPKREIPKAIADLSTEVIEWDERALVDAIRVHARHEKTGRWDTIEFKLD